jgi:hypothetical protein
VTEGPEIVREPIYAVNWRCNVSKVSRWERQDVPWAIAGAGTAAAQFRQLVNPLRNFASRSATIDTTAGVASLCAARFEAKIARSV